MTEQARKTGAIKKAFDREGRKEGRGERKESFASLPFFFSPCLFPVPAFLRVLRAITS